MTTNPCIVAGPATVTLSSMYVGSLFITDLPGGLRMVANQVVDLGTMYTQTQILSSIELKQQILNNNLSLSVSGTTPS